MKKFVFIIPNSRWFNAGKWIIYPYNVCLLSAVLESHYDVRVIDCNAENIALNDLAKSIAEVKADFIGISCLAVEYSKHAHAVASVVKDSFPLITVILGGVYCTLMPECAMEDTNVDYCVLGEGEVSLTNLLECIENGGIPNGLNGVAYRNNGKVIIKPQKQFIQDLDSLPLPDFEKVNFMQYLFVDEKFSFTDTRDATPAAKIYTSRGCPAGCNFCAVENIDGKIFRARSVESILNEIEWMINKYGIKEIVFYDDNLLFNQDRAKKLFRGIIDRKFNLKLKPANVAVYRMDKELLDLMKQAGVTMLVFAVESANNRVLKNIMGKPLQIEVIKPLVNYAKELGFRCAALFVIGNPGETWDEIRETFRFAESLEVYCHFSIATPLPKTRLYNDAVKDNYLVSDFSFHSGHGCSRGWILTDEFSPFDVEALRVYEWDRVNFSTLEKRKRVARFFKLNEEEIKNWPIETRRNLKERYEHEEHKRLKA